MLAGVISILLLNSKPGFAKLHPHLPRNGGIQQFKLQSAVNLFLPPGQSGLIPVAACAWDLRNERE